MSNRNTDVLLEAVIDQNDRILEAVGSMREQIADLPTRSEFNELKADVTTIKHAVKETNHDLGKLKTRVTTLEIARP